MDVVGGHCGNLSSNLLYFHQWHRWLLSEPRILGTQANFALVENMSDIAPQNPAELADFLIQRKPFLPPELRRKLGDAFAADATARPPPKNPPISAPNTAEFDLYSEVKAQVLAARALRESVIDGNSISGEVNEVKNALQGSSAILKLAVDLESEVLNQRRVSLLQQAVVETLKELDLEVLEKFKKIFDEKLKHI